MVTIHGFHFVGRKGLVWRIGEDSYADAPKGFQIGVDIPDGVTAWPNVLLGLLKESGDEWLKPGVNGRWIIDLDAFGAKQEALGFPSSEFKGKWEVVPQFNGRSLLFTIQL